MSATSLDRVTADLLAALDDRAAWARLRNAYELDQLSDDDESVADGRPDCTPSDTQPSGSDPDVDRDAVREVLASIAAHPLLGSYLLAHCLAALDGHVSTLGPQQDAFKTAMVLNASLQYVELAKVGTCALSVSVRCCSMHAVQTIVGTLCKMCVEARVDWDV